MEERLKGLRKSMKQTTFKQLNFTEQQRKQVHEKIHKRYESEEELLIALLHLLIYEKTGYDLIQLLRARGIQRFEKKEGSLYILLHRLEQAGVIQSSWDDSGEKYYQINQKGRKLLRKAEKNSAEKLKVLNQLIQE
jgi:hypothetical protein